jgi:diguanylate cyclase (GGDEF)-like protein
MRRAECLRNRLVFTIFGLFALMLLVGGAAISSIMKASMVTLDQSRALGDLRLVRMYLDLRAPGAWEVRSGQLYKGSLQVLGNPVLKYDLAWYLPPDSEVDFIIGTSSEYETTKMNRLGEHNFLTRIILSSLRGDSRIRRMLPTNDMPRLKNAEPESLAGIWNLGESIYLIGDSIMTQLFAASGEAVGWMYLRVVSLERGEFERRIYRLSIVLAGAIFCIILFILYIILYRLSQPILRMAQTHAMIVQQKNRLEVLSRSDPLTGLLNRRGFEEAMADSSRTFRNFPYALAMMDLDDFKTINDTYGHSCGDFVLARVAAMIQKCVRRQDLSCRLGGEEFLVCYPDATTEVVEEVAERLRASIAAFPMTFEDRQIPVTVTVGTAVRREGEAFAETLARADAALYQGKRSGKNRIVSGDGLPSEGAGSSQDSSR